ncbi:MAG TPA: cation:proton antiporter [Candidatus Aquicultor sp.]|jgi:CPA2 family monovalent cation:H+ antiporter-2
MELALLRDIVILFGLAIIILYASQRLGLPTIIGYIVTGIVAGPYGLKLIAASPEVSILADIGLVLMLFTIGIEFSFNSLLKLRRSVLLGGSLQVALTFSAGFLVAREVGLAVNNAIFIGFLVSLSSTAIVLKVLQDRAEIDTPHGKTSLGVLIFQDIIVVPMMLVIPLLAGATTNLTASITSLLLRSIGIILFVIISAKWIVPNLLYQIARTRSREIFLIAIVLICLASAWLTSSAGLSLALGAFLAGLIISESEYSHQALGNIFPFRDIFSSFFFISIGMLLDVGFLVKNPQIIIILTLGILLLKGLLATTASSLSGFPARTAILVGIALCQVGEFSFVLSETGLRYGLLPGRLFQLFLDITILTMVATPLLIKVGPRFADTIVKLSLPAKLKYGWFPVEHATETKAKDHIIIVGYGLNGRNVARRVGCTHPILDRRDKSGNGDG